jgi:hypothetical protein
MARCTPEVQRAIAFSGERLVLENLGASPDAGRHSTGR